MSSWKVALRLAQEGLVGVNVAACWKAVLLERNSLPETPVPSIRLAGVSFTDVRAGFKWIATGKQGEVSGWQSWFLVVFHPEQGAGRNPVGKISRSLQ